MRTRKGQKSDKKNAPAEVIDPVAITDFVSSDPDAVIAVIKKNISFYNLLLREFVEDYHKFKITFANAISNHTIEIPAEERKKKSTIKKFIELELKMQEAALALVNNPDQLKKVVNMYGDLSNAVHSSDASVQNLFSKNNIVATDVSALREFEDFSVRKNLYKIERSAREALTRQLGLILDNLPIEGTHEEKSVKVALVESLKCTNMLKEILINTLLKIALDYLSKHEVHRKNLKLELLAYPLIVKIIALMSYLPTHILTTIITLEDFQSEFNEFKNTSIDIRTALKNILPELTAEELRGLTLIVSETRGLIINFAENSYAMSDEVAGAVAKHNMLNIKAWKNDLFVSMYNSLEQTPRFASDAFFRHIARKDRLLQEKKINNPDFFIKPDYESYMGEMLISFPAQSHVELTKMFGSFEKPYDSNDYKDNKGRYVVTSLGLFAACRDNNFDSIKKILALLNNDSINQICDDRQRNSFIVALQNGRTNIIVLFVNNKFTDFSLVENNSWYAHLLQTDKVQKIIRARQRLSYTPAESSISVVPTPKPELSAIIDDDCEHEKPFFDNLPARQIWNLLDDSNKKMSTLEAAEEKISRDVEVAISAAQRFKAEEDELIASGKKSQGIQLRDYKKSYLKLQKSLPAIEEALLEANQELTTQLEANTAPPPEDIIQVSEDPSAPDENNLTVSAAKQKLSMAVTFFYSPATASSSSYLAIKAGLIEDIEQLKNILDFGSADTGDGYSLTLMSLEANAILFKVLQFAEKYRQSPFPGTSDKIAVAAKFIRNALVHCKDMIDENIVTPKDASSHNSLNELLTSIRSFANILIDSYRSKDYTALVKDPFYIKLLKHGNILQAQIKNGQVETVTAKDRIFYTQRLRKMQLRFHLLELPDTGICKITRDAALNMLLSKLQTYGIYYLPRKVTAAITAERHFELPPEKKEARSIRRVV